MCEYKSEKCTSRFKQKISKSQEMLNRISFVVAMMSLLVVNEFTQFIEHLIFEFTSQIICACGDDDTAASVESEAPTDCPICDEGSILIRRIDEYGRRICDECNAYTNGQSAVFLRGTIEILILCVIVLLI